MNLSRALPSSYGLIALTQLLRFITGCVVTPGATTPLVHVRHEEVPA
jgi:hypothetical protein